MPSVAVSSVKDSTPESDKRVDVAQEPGRAGTFIPSSARSGAVRFQSGSVEEIERHAVEAEWSIES